MADWLSVDKIRQLAQAALEGAGTSVANAAPLARAVAAAERDGIASHGLLYVPVYVKHVQCGKVDGQAEPRMEHPRPATILVDAATGFAHSAISLGFEALIPAAREFDIAALAIRNSYNCGVLGYHTERLASKGIVGLGFTNAPASIAPAGGTKPVIGTNPFSLATPDGKGGASILIDQSASVVAKSEVIKRAREGYALEDGWALDAEGNPTTDPDAALKGTMAPSGGYKGVGTGLLTEVMAAALAGATLGVDASPFSGTAGGPPKTGQFFIAIDPAAPSGGVFSSRMDGLIAAIGDQPGARIPGSRRLAAWA
ncbi:MAG TPA: Ldh family oxidoreductase, partial [Afifellaceae bacterium]|nr:Ldh family oxidoreductase [Afifellaceae bacterium]